MNKIIFSCVIGLLLSCAEQKEEPQEIKIHEIISPAKGVSAQPFLFSGEKTLLSWIENEQDSLYTLKYAELKNNEWSAAKTIVAGSNWFVNWADFPAIAEHKGRLLSHFLEMSAEGTYTYDIKMKLGNQVDSTWRDNFVLHNDGKKAEHGFVSMQPSKEDSFFVTWLDGRNTAGGHDHGGAGAMTLRSGELTFEGTLINEIELDHKTCDCCQTSTVITDNGPIVLYRDRSDDEIRDIFISRNIDGNWTKPQAIFNDNWKIEGCPVNGPKAVADGNTVAVAWYTGANKTPKVNLIFSKDGGASFEEPILIDEIQTIGRVDVALIDKNNVLVSWVSTHESKTVIKSMKVNVSGDKAEPINIAELNPSRSSGFPQLEVVNNTAIFAWVAVSNGETAVKTASVAISNF